jgi:hypothetical protein
MASIAEVRQKYPEYNDLSDEQLGKLLHQKYYSDIPYDEFAKRTGVIQQAPMEHVAPQKSNVPTWQNIAGEALGGFADIDQVLRTPAPLGAMIQAATGMNAPGARGTPPLMGDEEFHNSAMGRGIRFAAPSAVPAGASSTAGKVLTSAAGAGAGFLSGVIDKSAEDANLPAWQRTLATMSPLVGLMGLTAGAKGLARGGPSKGREMADNIANLEKLGITDFSVAQVAPEGNSRLPLVDRGLSFGFGGQGEYKRLGQAQTAQIQSTINKLAGGTLDQADDAGRIVWDGLFAKKTGWVSRSKIAEKAMWSPVDDAFAKGRPIVEPKRLDAALRQIVGAYDNPGLGEAMGADKVAAKKLLDTLEAAGGKLTYDDFVQLRTDIGELNSGSKLIPGERSLSSKQAGKLWSAMLDDYFEMSSGLGVEKELTAARAYSGKYHENSRNFFKTIFGKEAEPTKIIDELVAGNFQQPSKWNALRDALDPQDFAKTQEYVINRLGVPSGSSQASWSLETFHTNYKNAFGSSAKSGTSVADAVLGKKGTGTRDGLDALFQVASKTKEGSALLFNTSGTAGAGMAGSQLQAIFQGLAKVGPQMIGGGIGAAATGTGVGLAAGAVGGAVTVNLAARLITNPRFGRWLAKTAFQSPARLPGAITVLAQTPLGDEEAELAKSYFLNTYYDLYGAAKDQSGKRTQ